MSKDDVNHPQREEAATTSLVLSPGEVEVIPLEVEETHACPQVEAAEETAEIALSYGHTNLAGSKIRSLPGKQLAFIAVIVALLIALGSVLILPLLVTGNTSTLVAPALLTTKRPLGTLAFTSSGQVNPALTVGYNDVVTLTLHDLAAPARDMIYAVWLMPDVTNDGAAAILMGQIDHGGQASIHYAPADHPNLLATYSGVLLTEYAANSTEEMPSQDPTTWRALGWIPTLPAPGDENHYSLLSHLRHLLASDPTLQANHLPGGLAIWLTRNIAKVEEWSSAAQGQWHGTQTANADADLIHRHLIRILEYLDGQTYAGLDLPPGSPWLVDPHASKFGLLSVVPTQNPPGYLAHVDIHLIGLAGAPGHTEAQQKLAIQVDKVITTMASDLKQVRLDARALVKMRNDQLRQPEVLQKLNEMVNLTTEVKSGWFDPQSGENVGGTIWLMGKLQQLAELTVNSNPKARSVAGA